MKNFYKKVSTTAFTIPILMSICCFAIGAGLGVSWKKSEVTPVVIVEPVIGSFKPMFGSSIGNRWTKEQVKPVLLVKPGIGGFVPNSGSAVGNRWTKKEVEPVMLVEPSITTFIPLRILTSVDKLLSAGTSLTFPKTPPVIESKVDGAFNGWDGETIVKLSNGQIWQQSKYYYRYRYRYRPEVLIYKSGSVYKMIVEGVDKAVQVKRLK